MLLLALIVYEGLKTQKQGVLLLGSVAEAGEKEEEEQLCVGVGGGDIVGAGVWSGLSIRLLHFLFSVFCFLFYGTAIRSV